MHDPMTVAFTIPMPVPKSKWGYRPPLITVWHVDPETDGSDDSCGWSRSKITDAGKKLAREMAEWELEHPYYFTTPTRVCNPKYDYHQALPGDCLVLILGIFSTAAWRLHRKSMTNKLMLAAVNLAAHDGDNLQSSFALDPRESDYYRKYKVERTFRCVIGHYENTRRRWWQKPRWHIHHWKLQIHPLQTFKRWAFSRCCKCERRFSWGYAPVSGSWNSAGPQWFRSEENVYHSDCSHPSSECVGEAAKGSK